MSIEQIVIFSLILAGLAIFISYLMHEVKSINNGLDIILRSHNDRIKKLENEA